MIARTFRMLRLDGARCVRDGNITKLSDTQQTSVLRGEGPRLLCPDHHSPTLQDMEEQQSSPRISGV